MLKYDSSPFSQAAPRQQMVMLNNHREKIQLPKTEEWSAISYSDAQRLGVCCFSFIRQTTSSQINNFNLVQDKRRTYRMRYSNWINRHERIATIRKVVKLGDLPPKHSIEVCNLDSGESAIRLVKSNGKRKKAFIFIPKAQE